MTEPLARAAYDAAAESFDAPVCGFWPRHGEATVARIGLEPGMRVLDVCCGTGSSALAAARAVGATGQVIGVDISPNLLELARAKAARAGLDNIRFVESDALLFEDDERFDAVVCVFGIFFMPDMSRATRRLWSHVRPGGALAITTWADGCLEPGASAFWNAVQEVRPALYKGFNPWDSITRADAVVELYESAGIARCRAERVSDAELLAKPSDWWTIVMGTGFRATVEALAPEEAALVRSSCLHALEGVHQVNTSVVYALARKPNQ